MESAFTVIELLVVIGIIGIVASLLLTSIMQARVTADGAVCRSNLRQLGFAYRMYLDTFHCYPAGDAPTGEFIDQLILIQPYVNAKLPGSDHGRYRPDRSVWICPAYRRLGLLTDLSKFTYSYGYNYEGAISGPGGLGARETASGPVAYVDPRGTIRAVREDEVLMPSDMIELGDAALGYYVNWDKANTVPVTGVNWLCFGINCSYANWDILIGLTDEPPFQTFDPLSPVCPSGGYDAVMTRYYRQRHGGRWNLAFCDGHVENVRPQDAFNPWKAEQMQRWNRDHQPHNIH
jgi:prepilin-type processing-associated H-X9-DG protein/prepilin-type N-terminal cleavage/methylation domain-containing protein